MQRQKNRVARRGRRNGHKREMVFSTKVSNRHAQPRPVPTDLVCTTRQESYVTWTGNNDAIVGSVSAKTLLDTISGTSTVWDKVQFKRFEIYAGTTTNYTTVPNPGSWPSLTVTLNSSGVSGFAASDKPTFYCDPVPGQRRAHLSITPNTLFQESWIDGSNNEPILLIQTEPYSGSSPPGTYNFEVLIQFSVVLRSTNGTFSPATQEAVMVHAAQKSDHRVYEPSSIPVTITNGSEQPVPILTEGSIAVNVTNLPLPVHETAT